MLAGYELYTKFVSHSHRIVWRTQQRGASIVDDTIIKDIDMERTALRSRVVGGIRAEDEGSELKLTGWVHRRRDLGGLLFLDLRDFSGLIQISLGPDWTEASSLDLAHQLGAEDVVFVTGNVVIRPAEARNPEIETGEIEVRATAIRLLNKADVPAIPVYQASEDELPSEDLRLKHRVLDLRREELQNNIRLRHKLVLACRNFMNSLGFIEVETPILTKPTPEGARDYLVPSRVHKGEFYALPQSPQIYKQICMASGFDRYFQIARCFRDEDPRANRQPEFTQIDVEASFVDTDDILGWMEELMSVLAAEVPGVEAETPFLRMTYKDVLEKFGTDQPDLRYDLEIQDWTDVLNKTESPILNTTLDNGGHIRGLILSGGEHLSRKQIEGIESQAKNAGAPGLLWAKLGEQGTSGPLSRFIDDSVLQSLGMALGDLVLVAAGHDNIILPALSVTRTAAIEILELDKDREHAWLWIVDFPVFEVRPDGNLTANHHPFVMPHPEDLELLDSDPMSVRGLAYDLVYNGVEFGSGSIRNHDPKIQRQILKILGLSDEEINKRFGFLLTALASGVPPHGGVAFGMDRIIAEFVGANSIRDVIAFPKTTAARALFEGAPISLSEEDLTDLGIQINTESSEQVSDIKVDTE